MNQDWI